MQIHHVAVVVKDLSSAEAFYVGVLGLPVIRRWEERSIWVGLGSAFLAIERATAESPTRSDAAPGFHCLALGIAPAERESFRQRLAAAGHPVERESPFTLYVRDPDGNLVGLSHWPTPAEPPPGST